jgi:multidrug efflux pump subunit AcrB
MIRNILKHKTAANVIMIALLIVGFVALNTLNVQNFPSIKGNHYTINTVWPNASPIEMEENVTKIIENTIKNIDGIVEVYSYSETSLSEIVVTVSNDTDYNRTLVEITQSISAIENLPKDILTPEVLTSEDGDFVSTIAFRFENDVDAKMINQFKSELGAYGVSKVITYGIPKNFFNIEIKDNILLSSGMTISEWGDIISSTISEQTLGLINNDDQSISLTSDSNISNITDIKGIVISLPESNINYLLDDIAHISVKRIDNDIHITQNGKNTVLFKVMRKGTENIIDVKNRVNNWLESKKEINYKDLEIVQYNEQWMTVKERIGVLIENGIMGLILVVLVLNWALSTRVALWVTLGIPVAFFGGFILMSFFGISINMISIFGLIMVLGIVVDDAIVIGEQYETERSLGNDPLTSAKNAVDKMWKPIMVSTLTTLASFIPLLYLSGTMGQIGKVIPIVVISVVFISLLEAFFMLPSHLSSGDKRKSIIEGSDKILAFFDKYLMSLLMKTLKHKKVTIFISILSISLVGLLFALGVIKYSFFSESSTNEIVAVIDFDDSSTLENKKKLHNKILEHYTELKVKYPEKILQMTTHYNMMDVYGPIIKGNEYIQINFYIKKDDKVISEFSDDEFILSIEDIIKSHSSIRYYEVEDKNTSSIGKTTDLSVAFSGESTGYLLNVLSVTQENLRKDDRFIKVKLNTNRGREEWNLKLNENVKGKGISISEINTQVRNNAQGYLIDRIYEHGNSYDFLVTTNDKYRNELDSFYHMPIKVDDRFVPLSELVVLESKESPLSIFRDNGLASVEIQIEVNKEAWTTDEALKYLESTVFPEIISNGISYKLSGASKEEMKTKRDIKYSSLIAIILIFVVLCLFFQSYTTPVFIMLIIPFSCAGAILGHFIMGVQVSVMSTMAMFALAGIVVNDSVILVQRFNEIKKTTKDNVTAIANAVRDRFRAIFLTSVTTIAGLTPLMFEQSLEAQFLVPMAISMVFGLLTSTVLMLFILPSVLTFREN